MNVPAVDLHAVRAAATRIATWIHHTPVVTCATLDRLADCQLFFKCENLQKVGAFKFRGASNAVLRLDDDAAQNGVVTHSSGNHAQALALAARMRGITAHIIMPTSASPVKQSAVREYGGTIHSCEPTLDARETTAAEVQSRTGAVFVHPYDNMDIIAGQGTAALELLEQVPELDAIVAPIGGGGLISGICSVVHELRPEVRIIAAEPTGADDAARSKIAGQLIPQQSPQTIADGLLTSLGELTWPYVRDRVDRVVTVSDEQTVEAMRLAWQRAKLLIEPSAAVAVAVALSDQIDPGARRIGVVLSGGNVDLDNLPWM